MTARLDEVVFDCADQVQLARFWANVLGDAARGRLCVAGATAVADVQTDSHGRFQVMLDPEGNEFCLVRP
jgi:predicted enzyme related to lactoylglutathione lyase